MSLVIICKGRADWAIAVAEAEKFGLDHAITDWVVEWYGPYKPAQIRKIVGGNLSQMPPALGPNGYIVMGRSKATGPNAATKAPPNDQ